MSITPNSWNIDDTPQITPTFTITKYVGDKVENVTNSEYQIRKLGENVSWNTNTPIGQTTTFELYIKDSNGKYIKVDSETVDAVKNGTSPYVIELDNDNTTITAGKDGSVNATLVQTATLTNVTVKCGAEDITNKCYFTWSAKSGNTILTLKKPNGTGSNKGPTSNALYALDANYEVATLTVEVFLNSDRTNKIGSKT
jgi:hypothetical protein